jgi:L-ascorbate metabolism protein UlaG (beta-lactamase superfamily)
MTASPDSSQPDSSVHLTWLGTAGFLLRYRDTQLLMDPHLTRPWPSGRAPITVDQTVETDGILISHGHFDHAMDVPYLASVCSGLIAAPADLCKRLSNFGVAADRLRPNERTVTVKVGDLRVDVLPSKHIRYDLPLIAMTLFNTLRNRAFTESMGLAMSWPLGSNSDFLIHCGSLSIYHAGSLGADPEQRRGLKPAVALLPCAGRSNMFKPLLNLITAMEPGEVILHHHDVFWPGFVLPQPAAMVADRLRREIPGLPVSVAESGSPVMLTRPR